MLPEITEELRQQYLAQARLAKHEKVEWAKENLKLEYADEGHWRALASSYNLRLPQKYTPASSTKYVKRMAKALGVDIQEYVEAMGCRSLLEMVKLNPKQNAVAFCGVFLEYWHELLQTDPVEYEED